MIPTKSFGLASLVAVVLSLAGYSAAAGLSTHKDPAQTITWIATSPTQHLFITPSGQTFPYPTGPLTVGTRVLAYETLTQDGAAVGSDFEECTMNFGLNALCDDTVLVNGRGTLRVSWTFQWPSTGTSGPSNWSGPIMGGTDSYDGARGQFHAVANPDGTDLLTATFTTAS